MPVSERAQHDGQNTLRGWDHVQGQRHALLREVTSLCGVKAAVKTGSKNSKAWGDRVPGRWPGALEWCGGNGYHRMYGGKGGQVCKRYSRVQARAHGTSPALLLQGKAGSSEKQGRGDRQSQSSRRSSTRRGVYPTGVAYNRRQRTTRFSNAIGQRAPQGSGTHRISDPDCRSVKNTPVRKRPRPEEKKKKGGVEERYGIGAQAPSSPPCSHTNTYVVGP